MSDLVSVGIDVGGTKIFAVVCDVTSGEIAASRRRATPTDPSLVAAEISAAVADLVAEVGPASSIGIGLPGLVDSEGTLRYGPNVQGVLSLNMAEVLAEEFGVPTAGHNDGTCAVVAEHRLGAARGHADVVLITQGTGIGGGLIVNDQLVTGANGFAGEPGHMLVEHEGVVCSCGAKGCWEAYASGTGIAQLARQVLTESGGSRIRDLAGGSLEHIRGEHVSIALEEGDSDASEVLKRFVEWTAVGMVSLISLLDPAVVVVGGGLATLAASFLSDVESRVQELLMGSAYRPQTPIVAAQLGPESGAIGAAINGHDRLIAR